MPRYIVQVPGKTFAGEVRQPGDDVTADLATHRHAVQSLVNLGWVSVVPDAVAALVPLLSPPTQLAPKEEDDGREEAVSRPGRHAGRPHGV